MLCSHLYRCLNARIISIHPVTHVVRAFVNYDMAIEFHGKVASLPRRLPARVLQYHWDMCCLENTPSPTIIRSQSVFINPPEPPKTKVRKVFQRDFLKEDLEAQAFSGTQALGTQASYQATSSVFPAA